MDLVSAELRRPEPSGQCKRRFPVSCQQGDTSPLYQRVAGRRRSDCFRITGLHSSCCRIGRHAEKTDTMVRVVNIRLYQAVSEAHGYTSNTGRVRRPYHESMRYDGTNCMLSQYLGRACAASGN